MTVTSPGLGESLAAHRESIVRYIRGMVRDDSEAEDLTQEALMRAYRKLATLEDPSSLVPWLYRIATNVTYDRFRKASYLHRTIPIDSGEGDTGEHAPLEVLSDDAPRLDRLMEQKEMSSCVQEYIENLPNSCRTVILLHDVQGLTNPEIAEMLGVSLATAKIRLHRARSKLRAALGGGCSFSEDERGVQVCEPKPPPDLEGTE